MVRALFPGSFDPVTNGHLDLVDRARDLFASVTVAVADNADKRAVFSTAERLDLLRGCLAERDGVDVRGFSGLVAEFAAAHGYGAIVRGLRNSTDFEFEARMAQMNRTLAPGVDTVFLMTTPASAFVSSSLIKDIARHGGDVAAFVPSTVVPALTARLAPS